MDLPSVYPFRSNGDLVRLREVDADDTPAAMLWSSDPEFFRYLPVSPPATEDDERKFLDGVAAKARARPRVQYEVGIEDRSTGDLVGLVRLGIVSVEHREADLGYGLRRDVRGRGFATEAARLMLRFGFRELGLHRVFATHHPDNAASAHLLTRLGMTREGVLREHRFANGTWRDSVLCSILEHELVE